MRFSKCGVAIMASVGLGLACSNGALGQDAESHRVEARKLAASLAEQLGAALKGALAERGADGAVQVCKRLAPELATTLSGQHGVRISRVSLKPRNPLLGWPDAWEQQVLAKFDAQAAAGERPDSLEYGEIVVEPAGKVYRYMKALPTQALCLGCHGGAQDIAPAVKDQLSKDYPFDRATGYSTGQVRGAITVKKPL